jgi:hypothetical protein
MTDFWKARQAFSDFSLRLPAAVSSACSLERSLEFYTDFCSPIKVRNPIRSLLQGTERFVHCP